MKKNYSHLKFCAHCKYYTYVKNNDYICGLDNESIRWYQYACVNFLRYDEHKKNGVAEEVVEELDEKMYEYYRSRHRGR